MSMRPRRQATIAGKAMKALLGTAFVVSFGSGLTAAETAPPQPSARPSGNLEAALDGVVRGFARDPRFKDVPEQQLRERIEFVAGNVIFATVHEVGHMLIS